MDNPETQKTYWAHKTQNEDKQNKKHNTENKKEERQRPHQKIWGELER
jgi:hypothetical protein